MPKAASDARGLVDDHAPGGPVGLEIPGIKRRLIVGGLEFLVALLLALRDVLSGRRRGQDDRDRLVDRVAAAGYGTLVVTADTPILGNREHNIRSGFSMPMRVTPLSPAAARMAASCAALAVKAI